MIPLDSPRWRSLEDAYGEASPVADLLEELASGQTSEDFWSDLTSRICHQYSVYTGTFAAVPHLVEFARTAAQSERTHALVLVGLAEACAHLDDAPDIPKDLEFSYRRALREAIPLLTACLGSELSENTFRYVISALAALRGFLDLSFVLEAIDTPVICRQCGSWTEVAKELSLYSRKPRDSGA